MQGKDRAGSGFLPLAGVLCLVRGEISVDNGRVLDMRSPGQARCSDPRDLRRDDDRQKRRPQAEAVAGTPYGLHS